MSTDKHTQMKNIGERLRKVADLSGATYTGFAGMVDVPYSTLQNYMRGERELSAVALIKLSEHAGVNINWLLTGKGEPFTKNYLYKKIVDKLLIIFLHPILDYIFSKKDGAFTERERVTLISYMMSEDHLGLGGAIRTLIEEGAVHDFDDLDEWAEALKDMTTPEP